MRRVLWEFSSQKRGYGVYYNYTRMFAQYERERALVPQFLSPCDYGLSVENAGGGIVVRARGGGKTKRNATRIVGG